MSMTPRLRLITLTLLSGLIGACSLLPKVESPTVYLLPATALPHATATSTIPWTLRLARPQTNLSLQGNHIAVVPQPHVMSTYAAARWSDDVPSLLRDRMLDAFRDDGRINKLSTDDGDVRADLILGGELRAFQSEYQQDRPVVVLRYDVQLTDAHTQRIVATRLFTVEQPVDGKAVPQVVNAFGEASDQLARQIVNWTVMQSSTTSSKNAP